MKKFYTLSLIAFSAITMFAQSIPFTGTGLLTANGWTTHSGITGQLTILTTASDSGNSLSRAGLLASTGNRVSIIAGNSEDVNFPLTAPITGTFYYSVLVKVLDSGNLNVNTAIGDYFFGTTSVASATTTTFQARIYVKQGATATTFSVGVLNNSGGTAAPSYSATDLPLNTTNLLVVKYDLATNTASLFVNPTAGAVEPTATATNATGTTAAPAQIAGVVIRQAFNTATTIGTGNIEIDEIKTGTTFAAVTPASLSVNQNAIAGLSIYPNPVKGGVLYIDTQANSTKNVAVFDVLGKQVINVSTASNAVNVSGLTDGVYIVKITENGNTATRKLVINN